MTGLVNGEKPLLLTSNLHEFALRRLQKVTSQWTKPVMSISLPETKMYSETPCKRVGYKV